MGERLLLRIRPRATAAHLAILKTSLEKTKNVPLSIEATAVDRLIPPSVAPIPFPPSRQGGDDPRQGGDGQDEDGYGGPGQEGA